MANERIREGLIKHLTGGEAFMPITEVLNKMPFEEVNTRPAELPYSFYELFYHIVSTQRDIVKYTCSEEYVTPKWPDYYWPKDKKCKSREEWESLITEYLQDRERLCDFIQDEKNGLDAPVKNGKPSHTLLREVLLVIQHTAYHTGQMLIILRLLNLH